MASLEESPKPGGALVGNGGANTLLDGVRLLKEMQDHNVTRKQINCELWHACAGPLVTLPQLGSLVYYFPQGHSEQVAVCTNRAATTQIPNYPNLPPQLLCQVHNVTLHADKDTDEICAQMSLQPVCSEKDVVPIPDFGLKTSKHPTEFFCKTLTASDTSTHGGFSVPRRAAEKLLPPLDYSMQPPTQELIVRDLHENTWTFRHIYRGQPKRHLLTTGWSMFVGAKRLRAGDSVLFVRDEKSQLLVGVRRANRQQATLPSSVLSADSMHIGILAAAAHAAANGTPFTIFYNPRACSSEFVIPFGKYRKAVFGTQLSIGMRFGMMFETEESSKRRYMGTISSISDVDPLRWPNSKWRSLQVDWDEPGCVDRRNRVSPWEIETPESLFILPTMASNVKRPFHSAPSEFGTFMNRPTNYHCPSISGLWSEQLMKMLIKPPQSNVTSNDYIELHKLDHGPGSAQLSWFESPGQEKASTKPMNVQCVVNDTGILGQNNSNNNNLIPLQASGWIQPHQIDSSQSQVVTATSHYSGQIDYAMCNSTGSGSFRNVGVKKLDHHHSPLPSQGQELWDSSHFPSVLTQQDMSSFHYNSNGLKDLTGEINNQGGDIIYNCLNLDAGTVIDPSVSNITLDEMRGKNSDFQNPSSDYIVGNQDVQSQITSAADSQNFSIQDNSGGASSSNVDFDDNNLLQHSNNTSSWHHQLAPRFRTYTKIQKAGSVGRSIDVSGFKNYEDLRLEIERMFGLEGFLNDLRSGWKLVYVDFENDVLLVGDDPWEEFVGCVRCIRILCPSEVKQMGEEGMQLLNGVGMQGLEF